MLDQNFVTQSTAIQGIVGEDLGQFGHVLDSRDHHGGCIQMMKKEHTHTLPTIG